MKSEVLYLIKLHTEEKINNSTLDQAQMLCNHHPHNNHRNLHHRLKPSNKMFNNQQWKTSEKTPS